MKRLMLGALALVALTASPGYSQEEPVHSDIFFTYERNKIKIAPQNGSLVMPQVMADGGFFAQANENPGFFSERDVGGGTGPNDVVGYNVLDGLIFWSDGEFVDPRPSTQIRIINNPRSVEHTRISGDTGLQEASFDPLRNSIGQSNASGDFHAHVDFRLEPLTEDPEEKPLFGAYGLKLSLESDNSVIEASDPFFIVYQFGIEEEQFSQALEDFERLLTAIPGDFNSDGILSNLDIDLLSAEVQAGTHTGSFDLTQDQLVDELDRAHWVEELAGTFFGDANLDGTVQFPDFLALAAGFARPGGWANGDFDGNGQVQFPDFLRLASNFGKGTAATTAVPEPSSLTTALMALALLARRRRRGRR